MDGKDLKLKDFRPITRMTTKRSELKKKDYGVIDIHTHFGPLVLGEDFEKAYDTKEAVAKLKKQGIMAVCNAELAWDTQLARLEKKLQGAENFVYTLPSVDVLRFEEPGFEDLVRKTFAEYRQKGYKGIKLWKNITLYAKDSKGGLIRLDDPRLACVFDAAAENGLFVLIHIADPVAFFDKADETNEYYECLADMTEWQFHDKGLFSFEEHMDMQETMLRNHPKTTFVIAHAGSWAEDLGQVGAMMDRHPNMYIDIAARINELGRQPYTAREFFISHQDRIVFGSDWIADSDPEDIYPYYFRFLETFDEYFDYGPPDTLGTMGRWKIYGIGLPDEALYKIYHQNAAGLLGI